MNVPGALTPEAARRWFLAVVAAETSAFDLLREAVGPVFERAVEAISGDRPPYRLVPFGEPDPCPRAHHAAHLRIPLDLRGLPEERPENPLLRELAEALLSWTADWPFLRSKWALNAALFDLACATFGVGNLNLERPDCIGEVYGCRGGEPEPLRFAARPWYPTPAGPRRMPRHSLRKAFERYLDGYEARQIKAYHEAGGQWPEAKREDEHFRWLVWRLEGDSEGRIARRAHVRKPVVSRETGALAALLELPVTFAPGR